MAELTISISVDSFERFGVGLQKILHDGDLVAQTLSLLLESSGGLVAGASDALVTWCLSGDALRLGGAPAVGRTLLLERTVAGGGVGAAGRAEILGAVPAVLSDADAPVAARLAQAAARLLPAEAEAATWLGALWTGAEDVNAYAWAAEALLGTHGGEVKSGAWAVAETVLSGPNSCDRRLCTQRLLPPLVAATQKEEASRRLSALVTVLVEGESQSRADILDALSLTVSFHELLLGHWRMASPSGDSDPIGLRLIRAGLVHGQKEASHLRRHARFLLETIVHSALVDSSMTTWLQAKGLNAAGLSKAWESFWELFEALEEYGSHLLKAGWETLLDRILAYFNTAVVGLGPEQLVASGLPPAVLSPLWLEVLLCRALGHDNDTVQKFVLGQLLTVDQSSARLSEPFVLKEMLPRFSHGTDSLYPKTDVHQTFERRVHRFFSSFVTQHVDGAAVGASRLLKSLLAVRAVHYTPLRLVLQALLDLGGATGTRPAAGALSAEEALRLTRAFFPEVLARMPVSVRPRLSALFLCAAAGLTASVSEDGKKEADAIQMAVELAAAVPDALLRQLRKELGALLLAAIGDRLRSSVLLLMKGLAATEAGETAGLPPVEALGREASPMAALQLTLGVTRTLWAIRVADGPNKPTGPEEQDAADLWGVISPTFQDMHRRPYLSRRAVAAALFGATYGSVLLAGASAVIDANEQGRREALAYAEARAISAVSSTGAEEEARWVWLYALVFERLWCAGLPHGEAVANAAAATLSAAAASSSVSEPQALAIAAASALLGAVAPKIACSKRRAELFIVLWSAHLQKPATVIDERFSVCPNASPVGDWHRLRIEELDDLHRPESEGVGRILEWRDSVAVFLVAKWRALAALSRAPDLLGAMASMAMPAGVIEEPGDASLPVVQRLAFALVADYETLQPPHIAYWAIIARCIIYPSVFDASVPEERQRESLSTICRGLTGVISQGTGDGSVFMPRGCITELAAALCDPRLHEAESRLCVAEDARKPFTDSVASLLAMGENSVGVSRSIAVPLLSALLCSPGRLSSNEGTEARAAELLTTLLLHRESAIIDGAYTHSPDTTGSVLDAAGPGGKESLSQVCPNATSLLSKYQQTTGLPRVLALTAMDALAESCADGKVPRITQAALKLILGQLRETLQNLLKPPGSKVVLNRPPTPMPWSAQHRTQLRGWQATLVLGRRADAATAGFLLPELFHHLMTPHVPDVRDYQELLGCVLCTNFEELAIEPLLVPALLNHDAQVQALGPEGAAELLPAEAPMLLEVTRFLTENKECGKMRERLKPVFADFDPLEHTALACFTERSLVLPNPVEGGSLPVEHVDPSGAEHLFADSDFQPSKTFLALLKDEVSHEMDALWNRNDLSTYPSCSDELRIQLASVLAGVPRADRPIAGAVGANQVVCDSDNASAALKEGSGGQRDSAGIQRKYAPPAPPASPDTDVASTREREPLIVIASLIDKAPNLAGLCRTAEIFNCQSVCLPNVKITKESAFQSISVTAEKWLPIREVPRSKLRQHLLDLRSRGYALVGVEQTSDSVILDKWEFAPRTAILLGAEKEGIDAEFLPLLDGCVEIPQTGQLRSLNVHVSGSLAIWEYVRQRRAASGAGA